MDDCDLIIPPMICVIPAEMEIRLCVMYRKVLSRKYYVYPMAGFLPAFIGSLGAIVFEAKDRYVLFSRCSVDSSISLDKRNKLLLRVQLIDACA